jgi:hypothetical protein
MKWVIYIFSTSWLGHQFHEIKCLPCGVIALDVTLQCIIVDFMGKKLFKFQF